MWIRSQDKKYFIEVNAFEIKRIGNVYFVIGYHTENSNDDIYWYFGNYSSEEKAIKVLDMIQDFEIRHQANLLLAIYQESNDNAEENMVFQMPQDSKVEV